jgi:hypothetical protein
MRIAIIGVGHIGGRWPGAGSRRPRDGHQQLPRPGHASRPGSRPAIGHRRDKQSKQPQAADLRRWCAPREIRTPNRQIRSLVLCVDLVRSRQIWAAHLGCPVDPDRSSRVPPDRLDDQRDDQPRRDERGRVRTGTSRSDCRRRNPCNHGPQDPQAGSVKGVQLVVEDIDAVREALASRGVPVGDVQQLGTRGYSRLTLSLLRGPGRQRVGRAGGEALVTAPSGAGAGT